MIKHYLGTSSKMLVLMNFVPFLALAIGWFMVQGTASYILMAVVPFLGLLPLFLEAQIFGQRLHREEESTTTAP
jgi:endonuclease/exonuclease/phosphatase (EEP) superfamily protein YafD